jgi:hypothetical protein
VPVQIHPPQSLAVVPGRDRGGDGGVGVVAEEAVSAQTKRVAIQRQAAAAKASAEYYAKKVESGDTAVRFFLCVCVINLYFFATGVIEF